MRYEKVVCTYSLTLSYEGREFVSDKPSVQEKYQNVMHIIVYDNLNASRVDSILLKGLHHLIWCMLMNIFVEMLILDSFGWFCTLLKPN